MFSDIFLHQNLLYWYLQEAEGLAADTGISAECQNTLMFIFWGLVLSPIQASDGALKVTLLVWVKALKIKVNKTYSMGFPLISAMMALSPPKYS